MPFYVGHAAAGKVEGRRTVQGIRVTAGGLCRNQELGVDKEAQILGSTAQVGRHRPQGIDGQRWPQALQVPTHPARTGGGQACQVGDGAGRPGGQTKGKIPQGVGSGFLPAPESLGSGKCAPQLCPTVLAALACHGLASRQVNNHGRLSRPDRPQINVRSPGQEVHRAPRIEAGGQGSAGIKPVALVVKGRRAAARVDVSFQDGDVEAGPGKQSGGCQSAHAGTDDDHTRHCRAPGIRGRQRVGSRRIVMPAGLAEPTQGLGIGSDSRAPGVCRHSLVGLLAGRWPVRRAPVAAQDWKFRAVGQGFAGGLGPLAKNYGVNI